MKTIATIRNCDPAFQFQCPRKWEELTPTNSPWIRQCQTCNREVYYCKSDQETILHAKEGHCIARERPDGGELRTVTVGMPKNPSIPTEEQKEASSAARREWGINDAIKNADADRSCPKCNYPAPRWRVLCRVCGFEMGREMEE